MSTTAKPQPAAEGNNAYHDTLLLIRPLQPLLAGFNHRNKNQHRVATWWASFNMLRRHVTKWADDLDQQAKARPKKRKRTPTTTTTNQGGDGSGGPAEARALWLRDVLMPKCYLAFSQLAADNQFAPLGLVLTGALAQLYSACVRFVGEAPTETEEVIARPKAAAAIPEATSASSPATTTGKGNKATKDTTMPPLASSSSSSSAAVPIRQVPTRIDDDDVGQVISRDSVHAGDAPTKEERAGKVKRRKKVAALTIEEDADDVGGDVMAASTEKKRRKGATTVKPKAKDGERLPGEKEKKKKKKSKKGDEFDSLFSSLF
ncbi:uncharacterized protein PG986_007488 [Apiospora aurea]|uniref:RNase MRP protein 1 RNA binding domain-containing protein n=1 Tax=Apiospora aurea TaxID=335848 RepID=A0ABR1QCQ7_9PEZI